ncbi:hypothetical protein [Polaribacter sp. HaHaR_3_91]|uniref:hypothetical protein n=1 Tax=Polaribacter sp. HaHaR_3_91 TaxID=2745561 RepID=UPI001C4E7664|nr:hypothetical protein [Polaribacter sp. HaHaR_3_91]QXP64429.1 hypothetical protein H0I27_04370 [Polaribacter sp. HaHaR_3_91]
MTKLKKMKKYSFLIVFFIGLTCFSQNYKGSLNSVEKDGLHKIMLTPEVRSASKNNFNFIRIKDSANKEVPYVLKYHSDQLFSTFSPIKIVSKKRIKDSITAVIIENKTTEKLTNLFLQVANTDISKKYNLFGSNDAKTWFGITSNNSLNFNNVANKSFVEKRIDFPTNTYQFLKIAFNDKNSLPINILGIGKYINNYFSETPITLTDFSQKITLLKDRKVTQIKFTSNNSHEINSISFDINTAFYQRNAKLIINKERKIKKKIETYQQVVSNFQLSSKIENTFFLNNLNEKEFIIEIENKDNPSLEITNITLLQKPVYIISDLKKKEQYQLIIDTTFSKPSYDLGNFISEKTSIIEEEVSVNNFIKTKATPVIIKEKPFWETAVFMWVCIIFVGVLITYFALDLLKDVKHQEKN